MPNVLMIESKEAVQVVQDNCCFFDEGLTLDLNVMSSAGVNLPVL